MSREEWRWGADSIVIVVVVVVVVQGCVDDRDDDVVSDTRNSNRHSRFRLNSNSAWYTVFGVWCGGARGRRNNQTEPIKEATLSRPRLTCLETSSV